MTDTRDHDNPRQTLLDALTLERAAIHARYPAGTTRYRKGCRCDECRAVNATHLRQWRRDHDGTRDPNDVDDIAVERAVAGDPPARLTRAERDEAVRRLHAQRLTDRQIAQRTRLSDRTVLRIRQRLGLPSPYPAYNWRLAA